VHKGDEPSVGKVQVWFVNFIKDVFCGAHWLIKPVFYLPALEDEKIILFLKLSTQMCVYIYKMKQSGALSLSQLERAQEHFNNTNTTCQKMEKISGAQTLYYTDIAK